MKEGQKRRYRDKTALTIAQTLFIVSLNKHPFIFLPRVFEVEMMASGKRASSTFIKQVFEEKDRVQTQSLEQMAEAHYRTGRVRSRWVFNGFHKDPTDSAVCFHV